MFQNTNIANSFNLYSPNAARTISSQSKRKNKFIQPKQTIQLHFVNPNILFLDHLKYTEKLNQAGKQQLKNTKQKRNYNYLNRPQLQKKQFAKQNYEGYNSNRKKSIQQKLSSYIAMEKVFLQFRKTGNFKMGHKQLANACDIQNKIKIKQ